MSIAINKKVKFDGARYPFSTFLRLHGDHHCACAQNWRHFSFFSKSFKTKKIKALRPKMTKIASRGSGLNRVHGAQLTVTFDSSCAIWVFLNFGRTKSGDVEDGQPPVVIIGAVTVWYTHKKALGACFKPCWSRRNVPRQLVMVWTWHTPMTKWWRRKMRRTTPASGAQLFH